MTAFGKHRYMLYSGGVGCLMHRSNDLNELIETAKMLANLFKRYDYEIRDYKKDVVWKLEDHNVRPTDLPKGT